MAVGRNAGDIAASLRPIRHVAQLDIAAFDGEVRVEAITAKKP